MQSPIKQSWATEKAMHLSVQPTLNKPQFPLFFVLHRYPPLEAILFKILLDPKYAHLSPNPKRWKKKKKTGMPKFIYLNCPNILHSCCFPAVLLLLLILYNIHLIISCQNIDETET